jgi:hypothetical protein
MSDSSRRELAIVSEYSELHAALRRRMHELDISRETLNEIAGLQSGYSGKLLAPLPGRILGPISLGAILGALALKLVIIEDPAQLERLRPRLTKRHRGYRRGAKPKESPAPPMSPEAVAS